MWHRSSMDADHLTHVDRGLDDRSIEDQPTVVGDPPGHPVRRPAGVSTSISRPVSHDASWNLSRGGARLHQADLRLEASRRAPRSCTRSMGPRQIRQRRRARRDVRGHRVPVPVHVQPHAQDRAGHGRPPSGSRPAARRPSGRRGGHRHSASGWRASGPTRSRRAPARTARAAAAASHHARAAGRSSRSPTLTRRFTPAGESQSDPCGRPAELAIGDRPVRRRCGSASACRARSFVDPISGWNSTACPT